MAATFVVTLREGFEAALLLGIVYACLDRFGARHHYRWVTLGGAVGLVASILMGIAVTFLSGPLLDLGPDLVGATVIFAAVGLLTWHGWWMSRHAHAMRSDVKRRVAEAEARRQLSVLGLIAFTGVFREGAETVLFLWGLMSQTAEGASWGGLAGGVLGVLTAAALGWTVFRGGTRLSVRHFFTVTSVVLLLVAAGLFSTGLGKLQGLGVLPPADALWDTSFLVSDHGLVGGFATGLVGYRARPTLVEVTGYALYLVVAGALLFGGRRATGARTAGAR
jgi:high-affinity iron transporter